MAIGSKKETKSTAPEIVYPPLPGNINIVIESVSGKIFGLESEYRTLYPDTILTTEPFFERTIEEQTVNGKKIRYILLQGATQELIDNYNLGKQKGGSLTIGSLCSFSSNSPDGRDPLRGATYITKIFTELEVIEKKQAYYGTTQGGVQLAKEGYADYYQIGKANCLADTRKGAVMGYLHQFIDRKIGGMTVGDLRVDYDLPLDGAALEGRSNLEQELQNVVTVPRLTQIVYAIKMKYPEFIEKPRMALDQETMPALLKDLLEYQVNILKHQLQPAFMMRMLPEKGRHGDQDTIDFIKKTGNIK